MRALSAVFVLLIAAFPAEATDFVPSEKPDPFVEGAMCTVPELLSYGGYVYQWPSRFDLVFEPWVSLIAKCRASGYAGFTDDFDDLTESEKPRIAEFLKTHPWRASFDEPTGEQAMLDQLEAIYALQDRTLKEQAYILRVRAWLYGKEPHADEYRSKALAVHKRILAEQDPKGVDLMENLYVAQGNRI